MSDSKLAGLSRGMIYTGTLLISLLSFFTTYQGLTIIVSNGLALIGSLGLQMAMLGIAWNILRMRGNKLPYVIVFSVAASFSMFFSYANFNSNLKESTRAIQARADYAEAARPVLRDHAALARKAIARGDYQVERISHLLELERTKGWATVVDEGSRDKYIQDVIEGARRTAASWKEHQGSDYHQGAGEGIIVNYLTTWLEGAGRNVERVRTYTAMADSAAITLTGEMAVLDQARLVHYATVNFPLAEISSIMGDDLPALPTVPAASDYPEQPANSQQALKLVISDLFEMDRLTSFSLALAVVIDLIVIVMAVAGGHRSGEEDFVLGRIEKDASRRFKRLSLRNPDKLSTLLDQNLERLRKAGRYSIEFERTFDDFMAQKRKLRMTRAAEETTPVVTDANNSVHQIRDSITRHRMFAATEEFDHESTPHQTT